MTLFHPRGFGEMEAGVPGACFIIIVSILLFSINSIPFYAIFCAIFVLCLCCFSDAPREPEIFLHHRRYAITRNYPQLSAIMKVYLPRVRYLLIFYCCSAVFRLILAYCDAGSTSCRDANGEPRTGKPKNNGLK